MLIAPFATAFVLAALWLVAKLALDWAAEDGERIAAALRGKLSQSLPVASTAPVSVRFPPRAKLVHRAVPVKAEWRAAA